MKFHLLVSMYFFYRLCHPLSYTEASAFDTDSNGVPVPDRNSFPQLYDTVVVTMLHDITLVRLVRLTSACLYSYIKKFGVANLANENEIARICWLF